MQGLLSRHTDVGRGFLFITGAKVYFLATATLTTLIFPRLFGDPAAYGGFRVVSGILNVITMVVITATVQAAAKLASEAQVDIAKVRSVGMKVQALVFGTVFLAAFALSGPIASQGLDDPALEAPLRVASLVVAAYAAYALLVGVINGTKRFALQAGLDVTFSTLKTASMVAVVALTASATWAFAAFALSAFMVLALALFATRSLPTGGRPVTARRFVAYLLPLAGYALTLNLLLQADVIALKAAFGRNGPEVASSIAGIYGAARNAALLPYQVVISLTFVVFPLVSRATSQGDHAGAAEAASSALRLASILSAFSVAVFGAAPSELLTLLFGKDYGTAGHVFVPLLLASGLTAAMYVGNAILASAGRPNASMAGAALAVAVQVVLLCFLTAGSMEDAHTTAATATLSGSGAGAVVTLSLLRRVAPLASWLWTLVASALAAAASIAVTHALSHQLPWPALFLCAGVIFIVATVLLRAVDRSDLDRVRRAFERR